MGSICVCDRCKKSLENGQLMFVVDNHYGETEFEFCLDELPEVLRLCPDALITVRIGNWADRDKGHDKEFADIDRIKKWLRKEKP